MLWKKILNNNTYIYYLLFILIILGTRLPLLTRNDNNPDGVNWHYRSQQFVVGLKTLDLEKTYQHYHPGVTLMWLTGIPVEIYKQISGVNVYDMYNYETFHFIAKISLVISQLILSILILYFLNRFLGPRKSFLVVLLFSLEPFFLGNSRIYHMDVLFSLFLFLAFLVTFTGFQTNKNRFILGGGILLALSFLTKSIGIGAFIYVLAYTLSRALSDKSGYKRVFILGSVFAVSSLVILPALIVKPFYYLTEIFSEAERVGIRKGHGQILFGEYTRDAGLFYYPLIVIMKTTILTLLGSLLFFIRSFRSVKNLVAIMKSKFSSFTFFITIFYVGYFCVMLIPAKKLDRYMLPLYPFLSYLAVLGYYYLYKLIGKVKTSIIITILGTISILIPLVKLYPYYFTYTSFIFGSSARANEIIAQKPFGVGIFELKDKLVEKYGNKVKLGFIDIKPMSSIWPNSQLFDTRVYGPGSYDLLVLGVNEEFPSKVSDDKEVRFEKGFSLYINGLEYWRVYEKRPQ